MTPPSSLTAANHSYFQPVPEETTRSFLETLNQSGSPPMETLSPQAARGVLEEAQKSSPVNLAPAEISQKTIEIDGGNIPQFIVKPTGSNAVLPVFMFFHGGGWVLGDFPTHERFVRDLVAYSGAAAVFVDYARSPEARYPMAFNQVYAATQWVAENGNQIGVDGSRLAVVGNSAGGNLAAAVALRAKLKGQPKIRHQVLFWPVTDANFNTESYHQFKEQHFLTREMMKWFWDNYTITDSVRNEIFASPLRASVDQLKDLPPTLIVTAEMDVLRDEGEAFGRMLTAAGVDTTAVRVNGMIHDFGLLNALSKVPAVQACLRHAGDEIRRHLE